MACGCFLTDQNSHPNEIEKADEQMRSQEVIFGQSGRRSSGCSGSLSTVSRFSCSDSPIATPNSLYSQVSFPSPGWREVDSLSVHSWDRLPIHDNLTYYNENVGQTWVPVGVPREHDRTEALLCQSAMSQYSQTSQDSSYYHHGVSDPAASVSNRWSSRPSLDQFERIPNMTPVNDNLQWMASIDPFQPQGMITPSQFCYQAPLTPLSPCPRLPAPATPSPKSWTSTMSNGIHSPETSPRTEITVPHNTRDCADHHQRRHLLSDASHDEDNSSPEQPRRRTPKKTTSKRQQIKQGITLENLPPIIKQVQFKCSKPGCKGRFKRQEHLKRHMKIHSQIKPHICWVPGCHRAFSRGDNLNAHYSKTHSKKGGRNRYVSTLDKTSSDYDPNFRGYLTPDGRPIYVSIEGNSFSEEKQSV